MLDERDADGLGNERHGARGADDAVAYGRSRTYMCGRAIFDAFGESLTRMLGKNATSGFQ